jgi:glutamine amidotransferase
MLTIIDYRNTNAKEVESSLSELTSDIVVSCREADILKSDKLIIPDSKDILSSIKKLHLLNLFSILRMIKKPILGIGTGMHLMTKSFKDNNAACLGCFPVECATDVQHNYENLQEQPVTIIRKTQLLKNVAVEDKFYFEGRCFISRNKCTTSVMNIGGEITASLERDHLYGVQFNPEKSGKPGLQVLKNFLEI